MKSQRNEYFDFLRGIAIIMVIGIHTMPALAEYDNFGSVLTISFRQILNCAVPIFLAISGYFIVKKDFSTGKFCVKFWRKQIPAVYIPCLVFSLGWFALYILRHGTSNILVGLLSLVLCAYSVYYFIALIIQLYIVTPLLLRINKSGGVILCAAISGISIFVVTYMLQLEGIRLPLIVYAGPFVLWIVFYMLGIWLSTHSRNYPLWTVWILTIIGLVASVIESKYYLPMRGSGMGIKLSSFIFSAGIILLLFSKKAEILFRRNQITRGLIYVGQISFGIFLLHMYVRLAVGYAEIKSWPIDWILTLAITVGIIMIAKHLLPDKLTRNYLGFR